MQIRDAVSTDMDALADVFFRAVREGALGPYTVEQCSAWVPSRPTGAYWATRMAGLDAVVAEQDGVILGFMAWNPKDGDLDLAFVLPEQRGQGVSDALYAIIENRARGYQIRRLHTHASHLAKPFFLRQGWTALRENTVTLQGVVLTTWIMEKSL